MHLGLVLIQKAIPVGTVDAYEREMTLLFERYFAELQASTTASGEVDWLNASERLASGWDDLSSKVVLAAGEDAFKGFLLDNPYTKAWAAKHWTDLVVGIEKPTREAMHRMIADGVFENRNLGQIARDIRPLVGLREDQLEAVRKHFAWLRQAHPKLGLAALSEEAALAKAMTYAGQLLKQRCTLIARTEVMTANNQGTLHSWKHARDKKLILPQARRVWVANIAERTCPMCRAFAGKEATLDGDFTSSTGVTRHAPPAHPACRCGQGLRTRTREEEARRV